MGIEFDQLAADVVALPNSNRMDASGADLGSHSKRQSCSSAVRLALAAVDTAAGAGLFDGDTAE